MAERLLQQRRSNMSPALGSWRAEIILTLKTPIRRTLDKMPIQPNGHPDSDDGAPILDSGCLFLIGKTLIHSMKVGLIAVSKFLGLILLSIAIIFLPLRFLNVDTGFSLIIAAGVTLLILKIMGWIRLMKWLLSDRTPDPFPMAVAVCPTCYQSQVSHSIQNCPTCGTRWHN